MRNLPFFLRFRRFTHNFRPNSCSNCCRCPRAHPVHEREKISAFLLVGCKIFCNFAAMKPAQIFHQYIWIINTLKAYRKLTLEELNQKWQDDKVADGNPLQRSSFNRHRDAILDMFGIIIDCNKKTYKYYISNQDVLCDDSIERWLFSTLTVHGMLADSAAVKERLGLENAPAGEEYFDIIIRAIRTDRRLRIG